MLCRHYAITQYKRVGIGSNMLLTPLYRAFELTVAQPEGRHSSLSDSGVQEQLLIRPSGPPLHQFSTLGAGMSRSCRRRPPCRDADEPSIALSVHVASRAHGLSAQCRSPAMHRHPLPVAQPLKWLSACANHGERPTWRGICLSMLSRASGPGSARTARPSLYMRPAPPWTCGPSASSPYTRERRCAPPGSHDPTGNYDR